MSTSKKKSLVVTGPDKYHNPYSYEGKPERNYANTELEDEGGRGQKN